MAVSLKHATQAVGTDAGNGEIGKTQWNAEHTLTAAADTLLGAVTAGAVTEIACTAAARSLLDDTSTSAMLTTLGAAPLASPTFTGTPAAPTVAAFTDTTQLATTANVVATVKIVPENAQTGTTYTLALADAGKLVTLSNAAAVTLTVPTNASVAFPIDTRIDLVQYGAGQVTVAAASGVTIRSSGSKLKISGQYSGATLWKKDTNEWLLIGDITT